MVKILAKTAALVVAGIAILSLINPFMAFRVERYDPVDFIGYYEYSGVIGVHTKFSDGGLAYQDVGRLADSLNLHFVITADVNSAAAMTDSLEKRYGMTLMIPGVELAAEKGSSQFLVIGDSIPVIPGGDITMDSALMCARRLRSLVILARGDEGMVNEKELAGKKMPFDGIDLYNLNRSMRSMLSVTQVNKLLGAVVDYTMDQRTLNYVINYPESRANELDRLNRSRKTVGIATTTLLPSTIFGKLGRVRFPSYASEVSAVHTIIVTKKPYSGRYNHDRDLTIESLKEGHMYVAFSGFEPARGFFLSATSGGSTAILGDSLRLSGKATISISLPDSSDVEARVLRNGVVIHKFEDRASVSLTIESPGAYRVEVFQKRIMFPLFLVRYYPWIISNPIFIYTR